MPIRVCSVVFIFHLLFKVLCSLFCYNTIDPQNYGFSKMNPLVSLYMKIFCTFRHLYIFLIVWTDNVKKIGVDIHK